MRSNNISTCGTRLSSILSRFFFFNLLILRCLNGLNSPPICLNDSKVFVFPPSLKDRKKKGILFVKKVRKMKQMKQNKR